MAYQALYRKWRPMIFDDVVGQEHITKTLKNQIMNSQLGHAYLFCGTRGTGKTSTAKILARAVNCQNPQNGNPCNVCPACRGILDESITDVLELDGASRNKVENIRDIIDDVVFLPSQVKKKVYIIDEVHMVTTAAFNALLKTLEEPPEHVMFILATTELNKVPATVLSRCQRFDFRRITNDAIANRLKFILENDGKKATDSALSLIAELAGGSMRDSLSILDQCIGFTDDALDYEDVLNIIGIADYDALFSISEALAKGEAGKVLEILDNVVQIGKELDVFVDSLTKFIRDLTIIKLMDNPEKILNTSKENLDKMQKIAEEFSREKLINSLKLLNDSISQAKSLTFKRTVYELALVKMCSPHLDNSYDALLDRISELEKKLDGGSFVVNYATKEKKPSEEKAQPKAETIKENKNDDVPKPETSAKSEKTEQKDDVLSKWNDILSYIKAHGGLPLIPHLTHAKPMVIKDRLALVFDSSSLMSKTLVSKQGYLDLIKVSVEAITGQVLTVGCFSDKEVSSKESDNAETEPLSKILDLAKKHNVIEIID